MLYDKEIYLNEHKKSIELAVLELFLNNDAKSVMKDFGQSKILNWHRKIIKNKIGAIDLSVEIDYNKKLDLSEIDKATQFTNTILRKKGKRYDLAGERRQIEHELTLSISNLNNYLKKTFGIAIYKGESFPDAETKFMPFILDRQVVEKLDNEFKGGQDFYERMQYREQQKSNKLNPLGKGITETSNKLKEVSEEFENLIAKIENNKIKIRGK